MLTWTYDSTPESSDIDEQLELFDELLACLGATSDPLSILDLGSMLLAKARLLTEAARFDDALVVYDDLLDRFHDSVDPELSERVAQAQRHKALVLAGIGEAR